MDRSRRQRGFLLIVAIVLVVVASMLAVTITLIAATSGRSATDNLQSGQALFLADSGLEFEARRMAQNVDWYRSSTDPTAASGPQALGAGTFSSFSNFPATKLRRRLASGASGAGAVICVYTVDRFPTAGTIQIDDDIGTTAEFVTYTGTTASSAACNNLPAFTGLTRGVVIAGTGTAAQDHSRDDIAYPVTTLIDPLAASATVPCAAPAQLRITDNSKFLSSGTISLDDGTNSEDISYATSTRAGGVMTLAGLKRLLPPPCPVPWAVGAPVRPQLANGTGGGNDYEAQASAVGNVASTQRTMNRVLQR